MLPDKIQQNADEYGFIPDPTPINVSNNENRLAGSVEQAAQPDEYGFIPDAIPQEQT